MSVPTTEVAPVVPIGKPCGAHPDRDPRSCVPGVSTVVTAKTGEKTACCAARAFAPVAALAGAWGFDAGATCATAAARASAMGRVAVEEGGGIGGDPRGDHGGERVGLRRGGDEPERLLPLTWGEQVAAERLEERALTISHLIRRMF